MWADTLTTEEVVGTLDAAADLARVAWAAPLLRTAAPFLDRLRIGLTDKTAYSAVKLTPAETSFLFEIRFARELATAGLSAGYEHNAGVGNSSVDFRVDLPQPWFVELVSLHESEAVKAASWQHGVYQGLALGTDPYKPKQSEAGEVLKAQERIGAKAHARKSGPIKFPLPGSSINMIMVDARGYLGTGSGDGADWVQIAHGHDALPAHLAQHWVDPKSGRAIPISGLFQDGCPLEAAATVRERVHVIGFVCERNFRAGEITERAQYCCNPALFKDEAAARLVMDQWPLKRSLRAA